MTEHEDAGDDSFELDCLFNWMRLLTSPSGHYCRGELTIRVYGERDDSYVVIENQVSQSPMAVDQFLLHTQDFSNPLMALLKFLRQFSFDLATIFSKLKSLDYDEGGHARLEHVDVYFKLIEEYNPEGQDAMKNKDKTPATAANPGVVFKKRKFDAAPDANARSVDEIVKSISPFDDKGQAGKPSDVEEFDEWE